MSETIADIVCGMREHAKLNRKSDPAQLKGKMGVLTAEANMCDVFADRIEEANERVCGNAAKMREALERIRDLAYEVADINSEGGARTALPVQWVVDTVTAALAAPPDEHVPERNKLGNAARMREALETLVGVIDKYDWCNPLWWHNGAKGVKPLKDARAALAEPARNCDLAHDFIDLYKHFKPPASVKREMPPEWVDAVMAFCGWLITPAKEGGAK